MKIDTSELRLGNCVYFKNTHDIGTVEILHGKHFDCRDKYGSFIPNGKYDPIPLTEDILLKCGFVELDGKDFFICGYEINMKLHKNLKWVAWCNTFLGGVELKYLHELQNIYFALTKEELKINL